MSQINIRNLSNENDDGSPEIVGVSTFSATSFFVPPKGTTAERPSDCEPGSIRFNTDTANLEYFRGKTLGWSQFELVTPNLGGGTGSNTGVGARGVVMGGYISGSDSTNVLEFVTISTTGNAQDFGDLVINRHYQGGAASRTRGYSIGGESPGSPNGVASIDTFVFASTGNATDYGDLTQAAKFVRSFSNNTRAVSNLGNIGGTNRQNVLEYFNMASSGSAVDFGDVRTGDKAAAPRYIEARLSDFALTVLFNKNITEWAPSYDGRNKEPVSLPVRFPLVLNQGVEGIAVGLSTKILPHNFNELIKSSISILEGKSFKIFPDFQTGGMIDINQYNKGKKGGRVRVRSHIDILDKVTIKICLLYTSPSPRDRQKCRMPSSA